MLRLGKKKNDFLPQRQGKNTSSLADPGGGNTTTTSRWYTNNGTKALFAAFFFILGPQTIYWYSDCTSSTTGILDDITPVNQESVVTVTDLDVQNHNLAPPRQREEAAEMNAAKLLRSKINGNLNVKQTSSRGHEIILVSLLGGLMREEGLIPDGTFLDAGAQHGEQGAHFAVAAPDRRVLCLDPSPANVEGMKKEYGELPNLRIEQGGLSTEVGIMKPRDDSFKMDLNETFQLFTLDSLFYNKGEKLGFAHLDVEGLELDVLKGGVETLRAYKPILTTEIRVHDHKNTTELLKFLDKESYDTYIIDEVCGFPHQDLRNLLNIPRSLSRRMAKSDTFNLLHATESIFRVDVDNIFEVVLPCCAQGGECCPGGDLKAATCCDEKSVTNWYTKNNIKMSPASMFGWKNSRKAYETWQYRLRKRSKTP